VIHLSSSGWIERDRSTLDGMVELAQPVQSCRARYGWNDFSVTAAVDEYLGTRERDPQK
jgi:hypothetical protein